MGTLLRSLTYKGIPVWRHVQVIQWTSQIVSGVLVVLLVAWFFANIGNAIQDREIPHGFGFLDREYQTPIGQHFLPYDSHDTFLYAFLVAFTNTLIVSIFGVVLATALGIVVGVARMSGNWIVSKTALVYIEFFRNVPLLIQLFFWFYIVLALPPVREGYVVAGQLYLNNGGLSLPWPAAGSLGSTLSWSLLAAAGIFAGVVAHRWLTDRELRTGSESYPLLGGVMLAFMIGLVGWVVIGPVFGESPLVISVPEPEGTFGRIGGGFHHVRRADGPDGRAGDIYRRLHCRDREGRHTVGGPWTARVCPGPGPVRHDRPALCIIPQAMRVIVPPLISQYLNLTKNSSLAGAIGYSDLTNVAKTMTQTAPRYPSTS